MHIFVGVTISMTFCWHSDCFKGVLTSQVYSKFQIPVGIPQNSEFCRKLLPIRPEPRSGVLIFFIFTRPEPMNLDWRCDTRICRSKSELFHNHTNGIQEIQHLYMQACNAHVSCSLIFIATSTAQWQQINNGIPTASDSVIPPSVYKGNKSPRLPSPAYESQKEAGDGEFVWFFHFLPSILIFSHRWFSIELLFCCQHWRPSLSLQGE